MAKQRGLQLDHWLGLLLILSWMSWQSFIWLLLSLPARLLFCERRFSISSLTLSSQRRCSFSSHPSCSSSLLILANASLSSTPPSSSAFWMIAISSSVLNFFSRAFSDRRYSSLDFRSASHRQLSYYWFLRLRYFSNIVLYSLSSCAMALLCSSSSWQRNSCSFSSFSNCLAFLRCCSSQWKACSSSSSSRSHSFISSSILILFRGSLVWISAMRFSWASCICCTSFAYCSFCLSFQDLSRSACSFIFLRMISFFMFFIQFYSRLSSYCVSVTVFFSFSSRMLSFCFSSLSTSFLAFFSCASTSFLISSFRCRILASMASFSLLRRSSAAFSALALVSTSQLMSSLAIFSQASRSFSDIFLSSFSFSALMSSWYFLLSLSSFSFSSRCSSSFLASCFSFTRCFFSQNSFFFSSSSFFSSFSCCIFTRGSTATTCLGWAITCTCCTGNFWFCCIMGAFLAAPCSLLPLFLRYCTTSCWQYSSQGCWYVRSPVFVLMYMIQPSSSVYSAIQPVGSSAKSPSSAIQSRSSSSGSLIPKNSAYPKSSSSPISSSSYSCSDSEGTWNCGCMSFFWRPMGLGTSFSFFSRAIPNSCFI